MKLIQKIKELFTIKCDVCGCAGKKMNVYHFMTYQGKIVEDICVDCEEKVFDEVL